MTPATSRRRRLAASASIILCSFLATLIAIELGLRAFGDRDGDGLLAGYRLRPGHINLAHVEASLQRYLDHGDSAKLVYDEALGWRYRAHSVLMNGRFTTQTAGMRALQDYDTSLASDVLRIALIGDSFVADVDVSDEDSWGLQLERMLNESGLPAEVLNFGVEAFGMGQSYLRWQHNARAYSPDIVIFGVQSENLHRNVNLFRVLTNANTGIPLEKPRFILTDGELELINQPVVPPESLMNIYRSFENHPLAKYEFYYDRRRILDKWWSDSRLLVLLYDAWRQRAGEPEDFSRESERVTLGIAIVDAMAADVAATGAHFLAVHLPKRSLLRSYHAGGQSPFHEFLQLIAERNYYRATETALGPELVEWHLWGETGHYGPALSSAVGAFVAQEIVACVQDGNCDFSRRQALLRSWR